MSTPPPIEHIDHTTKPAAMAKSITKNAIGWSALGVLVNSCDQYEKAAFDGAIGSITASWNACVGAKRNTTAF